jgi:hypothetical protein
MNAVQSQKETMKTSYSSNRLTLAVTCALALACASGAAQAQNLTPNENRDTWSENSRTQVWHNAYGECWRNMYGPPPGYGECNPAPVAQYVAPAPAPVYVAPPPVQVPYVAPIAAPVYVAPELPPKKPRG